MIDVILASKDEV